MSEKIQNEEKLGQNILIGENVKLRKKMEHSSFTKYLLKKKLEGSQKRNGTIAPHSGGGS